MESINSIVKNAMAARNAVMNKTMTEEEGRLIAMVVEYSSTISRINNKEQDYKQAQERVKMYKEKLDELEKTRRALAQKINYSKNREFLAPHLKTFGLSYQDFA